MNSEKTILLVDDTKELNDAAARIIREAGYKVIQAFDGNECLELLNTITPDLLLLDVVMPGINGIEVCRQIKSSPETSGLFVVLLSGLKTSSDQQAEGLEAGADGYIARPVQNRELLARIESGIRIVTSERDMQKALNQSHVLEKKLSELNATKDLFLSIIAHDLKNPLNTILGFSQVLLEDFKELDHLQVEEYLGIIAETSKQTANLLDTLLIWAKAQSGKLDFNPEVMNIAELISDSIRIIENQAKAKNIKVVNESEKVLIAKVDKEMIKTVIRNLLSNSVKFTPHNGNISISASVKNDNIVISVTDSGIGISSEVQDKLFRIDNKINTKGTDNEKGTGLGLILCREFVERHGGRIWVESEAGKGSRFSFSLPG